MTESTPGTAEPPPEEILFKVTSGSLKRAVRFLRRALGWLTVGYVVGLVVVMIALEWGGERLSLLSLFLYAPAPVLLLPLLVLTPLCLIFRRRLCLWHLACVGTVFFGYMTFGVSGSSRRNDSMVTAVTFNYGESNRPQFMAFLDQEKPDFILMQDARNRGPEFAKAFPTSFVSGHGEFLLVSRYPIQKAGFVNGPNWMGRPVAARFEVLVKNQVLVLYSVHLPTPRRELGRFLGGRRILGDLVGWQSREAGFGDYREWLTQRIELARALDKVFRDETQPFLVAGDFNTPDHGYIYHLFADEMTDAFDAAGSGWGLTFPANTRSRFDSLSRLFFDDGKDGRSGSVVSVGPWLRIDYFFAGRGWKPVQCRPEPGTKSQHKAVFACFEPKPPK
jgi:endonuclease/exonuclease/phosphatase (EEP) superfamily protein YafD